MEEPKERTREELLHKIGELEDTIEQYRNEIGKFVEKQAEMEAKLFNKDETIKSLVERIEKMRYLKEKEAEVVVELSWKLMQYEKQAKVKKIEKIGKGD